MNFKYILLLLLLCGSTAYAQTSDVAARAAYLQAEQSYNEQHYAFALNQLDEAEKLLGQEKPRTLYLRILITQQLAQQDIKYLDPAMSAINRYLAMKDRLPDIHSDRIAGVQELARQLPALAQKEHTARLEAKALKEKQALKAQARRFRLGYIYGMPADEWSSTSSLTMGTKSTVFEFGISNTRHTDAQLNYDKLKSMPDSSTLKHAVALIGFHQGIRILPRKFDYIKPFIGVRAVYQSEVSIEYRDKRGNPAYGPLIKNIKDAGFDPYYYFDIHMPVKYAFTFDACAGVMLHYKWLTLMAGKEFINSKSTLLGIQFKL